MDALLMPRATFVVVKLTIGLFSQKKKKTHHWTVPQKKKKKTHRWTRLIWQGVESVGIKISYYWLELRTRLVSDTRCRSARYNGSTLKNSKVNRTDLGKKKEQ